MLDMDQMFAPVINNFLNYFLFSIIAKLNLWRVFLQLWRKGPTLAEFQKRERTESML